METREEKKQQFVGKNSASKAPLLLAIVAVVVVAVAGGFLLGRGGAAGKGFVKAQNGTVSVPLHEVEDGQAHYYAYKSADGVTIRFFVLKSSDGVVRAAFDACDVCYKSDKGYRQEGDNMVCNNCNQKFASDRINEVKGGCNPAPLTRNIQGDQLLLSEQELLDGSRYFPQI